MGCASLFGLYVGLWKQGTGRLWSEVGVQGMQAGPGCRRRAIEVGDRTGLWSEGTLGVQSSYCQDKQSRDMLTLKSSGRIIRISVCWNFEPLKVGSNLVRLGPYQDP